MSDDLDRAPSRSKTQKAVTAVAVGGTGLVGVLLVYGLVHWATLGSGEMTALAVQHFPVIIGLPLAALAALCLVLVLESQSGAIELEALGFKFRGAAGPIVMWILCYLAIVVAIRTLW